MKTKSIIVSILAISLFLTSETWARRMKEQYQAQVYSIIDPQDELIPLPFMPPDSTLLRDAEGNRFIVLHKSPRHDYMAYLLGRGIFNIPEIRIVAAEDTQNSQLSAWMEQQSLSEIGISMLLQDYNCSKLPMQDNSLEALIVFWTFLRDGDHHFYTNLYYLQSEAGQRVYMSYDHSKMNTSPVSISSWIENGLQTNFKRVFNVAKLNPDVVLCNARQTQEYYTDELLAAAVAEAGFEEEVLQTLKSRRDSLVSDIKILLTELGVSSNQDSIFLSKEQGKVILTKDTLQNVIHSFHPEITIKQIRETIENHDTVKIVYLPPQYIYRKDIGNLRITVKVNRRGEVFWAESEKLVIRPEMTEEDIETMMRKAAEKG